MKGIIDSDEKESKRIQKIHEAQHPRPSTFPTRTQTARSKETGSVNVRLRTIIKLRSTLQKKFDELIREDSEEDELE